MKKNRILLIIAGAAFSVAAVAQPAPPPPPPPPPMHDIVVAAQAPTFEFIAAEPAFLAKVVTGAPYSADVVKESTRTLADGTRIKNSNTSKIYRDSEGRLRNESTFEHLGFWVSDDKQSTTHITITDPVVGQTIILKPDEKIARVLPVPPGPPEPPPPPPPGASESGTTFEYRSAAPSSASVSVVKEGTKVERRIETEVHVIGRSRAPGDYATTSDTMVLPRRMMFRTVEDGDNVQVEELGEQTLQGVKVTGKRRTTTIPTGAIGNDRPIVSVSEEWYSPELEVVVQRTVKDPQVGESTYRLENLNRTEPLQSLFEIPSDYEVKETEPMIRRIQIDRKTGG